MTWNKNMDDAPRDGTELIFWLEGYNGLGDITANGYWSHPHPALAQWVFSDSHNTITTIIKGWQLYPQPPEVEG